MSSVKRQNTEAKGTISIPPTTYEQAPATLKNFPSSVVNGVTEEGGLYSLTFKSVACANLVENYEWIRQVVFKSESPDRLSRINPDRFDGETLIETLKKDIEQLNEPETPKKDTTVDTLKRKLEDAIESNSDFTELNKEILHTYHENNKNIDLFISDGKPYSRKIAIPNLKVDKYDESKHKDLEAYQRKEKDVNETKDQVIEIDEESTQD